MRTEPVIIKAWPVQLAVIIEALEGLHDDCEAELEQEGSVWEGESRASVEWKQDQCAALLKQLEMMQAPEAN